MSFLDGLKIMFKSERIYIFIFLFFIISWFLILIGLLLRAVIPFLVFVFFFIRFVVEFSTVLFVFSFFMPVEKMGKIPIIIALIIAIFIELAIITFVVLYINLFYAFCLFADQLFTAFFAFKLCMDYSQKLDDYLYVKERSRNITRALEFAGFGVLAVVSLLWGWRLFIGNPASALTFFFILIVDLVLFIIVIIRLLITKKFSAYISLFFLLAFVYIIYIVYTLISDPSFRLLYLAIDLFLFIYIIGSVFDKLDAIKAKLKILSAGTITLFFIVMKLVVHVEDIVDDLIPVLHFLNPKPQFVQDVWVLLIFMGFTLLFGIYSIIVHKEGDTVKIEEPSETAD